MFKIDEFTKNKHSHIVDIGIYAYLRVLFFDNSEEFGERAFSDSLLEDPGTIEVGEGEHLPAVSGRLYFPKVKNGTVNTN